MLLQRVVSVSERLAETGARREKVERLASLLREASPDEIEIVVAFLSGAPRQGRIGIGPSALQEARIAAAVETPALEVREVDRMFAEIAGVSGKGATGERVRLLRTLNARATSDEQRFLVRLVLGELRQGALEGLVTEAVARAAGIPAATVRRASMAAGELGVVARAAVTGGVAGLSGFNVQLFRPVQPMLAQSADDIEDALGRLDEAALEYKLDGARIQVHKAADEVRVFSRRLRDVTDAVPEVVGAVQALPTRELILDGEVIALKPDGTPHPFQMTMRRFGRKRHVERVRQELPLTPVLFDLLFIDGDDVTALPQSDRFSTLADLADVRLLVPRIVTGDRDIAQTFLEGALRRGHEGIMAKATAASYEAGGRGQAWLKVKLAHTLDLVVLAAEWGHGRRRGRLSNLHLGARAVAGEGFVMLGKTFKGLTDEMLAWQTERLLQLEIARDGHTVYVRPELVVEVAFNDVQESPQYPGGLALRFARVKRFRSDKVGREADSLRAVQDMFGRATGREPPAPR